MAAQSSTAGRLCCASGSRRASPLERPALRRAPLLLLLAAAVVLSALAASSAEDTRSFLGLGPAARLARCSTERRHLAAVAGREPLWSEPHRPGGRRVPLLEEEAPASRRCSLLLGALAAILAARPAAALISFTDNKDAEYFVDRAEEPGDNQVSDEQSLFSVESTGYMQMVAGEVKKATGIKVIMIAPPAGMVDGVDRVAYVNGVRQGLVAGPTSVVLVADAQAPHLVIDAGARVAKKLKGPFSEDYVKGTERNFGAPDFVDKVGAEAAALSAFLNVAACVVLANKGDKIGSATGPLPEERVRETLTAMKL